jgi:hypothetical protein
MRLYYALLHVYYVSCTLLHDEIITVVVGCSIIIIDNDAEEGKHKTFW